MDVTLAEILEVMNEPLIIGSIRFSLLSVLLGTALFILLLAAIGLLKRVLRERLLPSAGLNPGVSSAIATLAGYGVLVLGVFSILPVMLPGFEIATLSIMVGAVSFGLGFGLRNIVDNFVSGLILLIERPIKEGDRIEVGTLEGQVIEVRARSTTVRTNDNIDIIVPNAEFLTSRVTNLSHHDNVVRFRVPVGVHYESDVAVVEAAMLRAAAQCPDVLKEPQPVVRFMSFGDSSLNFEVRVWSETLYNKPTALRSQVNYAIWREFKAADVSIPYPQQDIYIKELPVRRTPGASKIEEGPKAEALLAEATEPMPEVESSQVGSPAEEDPRSEAPKAE